MSVQRAVDHQRAPPADVGQRAEWSRGPEVEIVRKAQRGDERAFSILVRAYERPVFNYVLRLIGDRSLAEDMTQEVFLRVYQGLPQFSFRSKFSTWLFQVTKNRVLDELRARARRGCDLVALDEVPPLAAVDAPFEQGQTLAALWSAIEGLPTDLKTALLLRDVVGLSYAEIADVLEITPQTVKWRIFEARETVTLTVGGTGPDAAVQPEQRTEPAAASGFDRQPQMRNTLGRSPKTLSRQSEATRPSGSFRNTV